MACRSGRGRGGGGGGEGGDCNKGLESCWIIYTSEKKGRHNEGWSPYQKTFLYFYKVTGYNFMRNNSVIFSFASFFKGAQFLKKNLLLYTCTTVGIVFARVSSLSWAIGGGGGGGKRNIYTGRDTTITESLSLLYTSRNSFVTLVVFRMCVKMAEKWKYIHTS